jgi:phospholipase C
VLRFEAKKDLFGDRAAGAPFIAYAFTAKGVIVRHYTAVAGGSVEDSWPLDAFKGGEYRFRVHGPNGFFREFRGDANDPAVDVDLRYARARMNEPALTGSVEIIVRVDDRRQKMTLLVEDNAYGNEQIRTVLPNDQLHRVTVETAKSFGWYDLRVSLADMPLFMKHYAGRVETGKSSVSDPTMGRDVKDASAAK